MISFLQRIQGEGCGCGTTIDAAEKLGRQWIGIDVPQLAISLIKNRLQDTYGRRLKFVIGSAGSGDPAYKAPAVGVGRVPPRGGDGAGTGDAGSGNPAYSDQAGEVVGRVPSRGEAPAEDLKFVIGPARSSAGASSLPLPQGEGMRVRVKGQDKPGTVPPHPGPLPPGEGEAVAAPTASDTAVCLVRIIGEPTTPNEAATLAEEVKYQFQWWALGLVGARPVEQKKGADHGIDGKIFFRDDPRAAKPEQIILQVKAGKPGVDQVRDLRGVLDREQAAMGVLITLQPPTKPMEVEAASLGFYEHKLNGQMFPRLQIRTVRRLMDGQGIERPSTVAATDEKFKKAPKAKAKGHRQHEFGI